MNALFVQLINHGIVFQNQNVLIVKETGAEHTVLMKNAQNAVMNNIGIVIAEKLVKKQEEIGAKTEC